MCAVMCDCGTDDQEKLIAVIFLQMHQFMSLMGQFSMMLLTACYPYITCTTTRQYEIKKVMSTDIGTGSPSMEATNVAALQCLSKCYDDSDSHSVVYQVSTTL